MQLGFRAEDSCVHANTCVPDYMRAEMDKIIFVKLDFGLEESNRFVGSYGTDEQTVFLRI